MRDQVVRAAFHKSVLKSAHEDPASFVVDELGLKNGEVRADIAVINGKMVGYEIKTDKDTLLRLSPQILAYNEVFDKAYIISGEKHLDKVRSLVPEWWGIYIIKPTGPDKCKFVCIRRGKLNRNKDAFGITQLLWKEEVKEIVESITNNYVKTRLTKYDLYDILVSNLDTNKITQLASKYLKKRVGWRINH